MPRRPVALALGLALAAGLALGACGDDDEGDGPSGAAVTTSTAPAPQDPLASVDERIDEQVDRRRAAAAAGDVEGVAEAEQALDALARERAAGPAADLLAGEAPQDVVERVLAEFAFKTAPLYVEQIRVREDGGRLDLAVDRNALCLMPPQERRAVVGDFLDGLRDDLAGAQGGVPELVVVPTEASAGESDAGALARFEGGEAALVEGACDDATEPAGG